jgi:hypothetical protein
MIINYILKFWIIVNGSFFSFGAWLSLENMFIFMVLLFLKFYGLVGCWWLMPVFRATWEAEIRRIIV